MVANTASPSIPSGMSSAQTQQSLSGAATPSRAITATQATIIVAVISLIGTFAGAYLQARNNLELKTREFESNLILRVVDPENVTRTRENLKFLVAAGLLRDRLREVANDKSLSIKVQPSVSTSLSQAMKGNDLDGIIRETLAEAGLTANFAVVPDPNARIAAATVVNGQRILLYEPKAVLGFQNAQTGRNWSAVALFAYEAGHHILGHVLDRPISNADAKRQRLEADEFSGEVMFRLGAKLDEATGAYSRLGLRESPEHPAPEERIRHVAVGWHRAEKEYQSRFPVPPNSR